jgi:polyisoprenoid-binding protein YceI
VLSSVFLFVACVADLSENRSVAEVQEPAPAGVAAEVAPTMIDGLPVPTVIAAKVLAVSRPESSLGALGAKITATHPITLHRFAGAVGMDGEAVTGLAFAAEVASLEADHPKLTKHLVGEDFLWAEKYPHATFRSTAVAVGAEGGGTHTVSGDLTIRGKTVRISFPATIAATPAAVTANTEFVIDRKAFGVVYPGRPDDLVQDNVVLKIAFVAPRV